MIEDDFTVEMWTTRCALVRLKYKYFLIVLYTFPGVYHSCPACHMFTSSDDDNHAPDCDVWWINQDGAS